MLSLDFPDFDFDLEIIAPFWLDSPPESAGEPVAPEQADGAILPPEVSPDEERRLRRMASNRESARRSRVRKQRQVEDLRLQEVRFRSENRSLTDRVSDVVRRSLLVRRENRRLWTQSVVLRRRLEELRRRLLVVGCLRRLAAAPASAAPSDISVVPAVAGGGGGLDSCYWEQTLASLMA